MNVPSDLRYTADHEWVKIDGDIATVGVTDFAQGELGDIVFVEVETEGEELEAEDVFGTIEAVKTVSDLILPLTGEVIEFNEALEDDPALINSDPFGDGWIIIEKGINSDILTIFFESFNLEEYYPMGERVVFDLSHWLHEGFVLREKEFRSQAKQHDWAQYKDQYVN